MEIKKITIHRIDPFSLGKVLAIFYMIIVAICAFFNFFFFFLITFSLANFFLYLFSIIFVSIIAGFIGFLSGILSAVIYNFIAKRFDGIKLEITH